MTTAPALHVVPAVGTATCTPLEHLRSTLQSHFIERDDAIDAMIRARVAGHHVVMLGPPGEGKSMLARFFSLCVAESYFEQLLTKFSTPDDLYGMMKLSAFQQDRYERHTTSFFQAAGIVFIDETFKGNPGVLNAMLTAMNERTWVNDGKVCKLPLRMLIGASNEYIEGPELGALWDRFLVRLWIDPVKDRANRVRMMQAGRARSAAPGPIPGLDMAKEQAAAALVVIPDAVDQAFQDVREAIEKAGHKVSDRRWIQLQSLVQAEAHIDGRAEARPGDLSCLGDALWNEEPERHEILRVIQKTVDPTAAKATARLDAAREAFRAMPKDIAACEGKTDQEKHANFMGAMVRTNKLLLEIVKELDTFGGGRTVDKVKAEVAMLQNTVGAMGMRAFT